MFSFYYFVRLTFAGDKPSYQAENQIDVFRQQIPRRFHVLGGAPTQYPDLDHQQDAADHNYQEQKRDGLRRPFHVMVWG